MWGHAGLCVARAGLSCHCAHIRIRDGPRQLDCICRIGRSWASLPAKAAIRWPCLLSAALSVQNCGRLFLSAALRTLARAVGFAAITVPFILGSFGGEGTATFGRFPAVSTTSNCDSRDEISALQGRPPEMAHRFTRPENFLDRMCEFYSPVQGSYRHG